MRIIGLVSVLLFSITLHSVAAVLGTPKQLVAVGFERNEAQTDRDICFLAHPPGTTIAVYSNGSAKLRSAGSGSDALLQWVNTALRSGPVESGLMTSSRNYYRGNSPAGWRTDVPLFQRISFREFYPGIELSYRIDSEGLEYEFLVSPGSNPGRIGMRVPIGWKAVIEHSGDLRLTREGETFRHRRPVAFQIIDGTEVKVAVHFHLTGDIIRLALPDGYDSNQPLVIDPVVTFSSYLGGSGWDAAYGVAADSSGNIYVTGETASQDFPGAPRVERPTRDVFVTKLKDGVILYTTILASGGNDSGAAIAVDATGRAYIAGLAGNSNFPVTAGAAQTVSRGGPDAFVARLDALGRIDYASFLGGSGADTATGIAVDSSGSAYVTGYTASVDFPTMGSVPQTTYKGGSHDAFVAKVNAAGSQFLYVTLLGGQGNDIADGIAVDGAGNAVVVGYTDSLDFPVYQPFQSQPGGGGDGFVASLNAFGTQWNFVTYLGGSGPDQAYAVALDAAANVYVTGAAYSTLFPVSSSAYQGSSHGNYDAFVTKLSPAGSFLYGTLLGGSATDTGTAISVDASGDIWVAGYTASFDFPTVTPVQPSNHGSFEGFISRVNNTCSTLLFSTYWGGSLDDRISAIAPTAPGKIVAAGYTSSTNFPTVTTGTTAAAPAGYNAFVTQIEADPPPTAVAVSPASGSGLQQSFSFLVQDSGGSAQIGTVLMMINSPFGFTGGCQFLYDASHAQFFLYDDGQSWLGPLTAGSTNTVNNGRCLLTGTGTSALGNGAGLTVTLNIVFQAGFTGQQKTYLYAQEGSYGTEGINSGWQQVGTWSVSPSISLVVGAITNSTAPTNTFPAIVRDLNGFDDIQLVYFLVNPAPSIPQNSCHGVYVRSSNSVYLYNDTLTGIAGSLTPGIAGIIQNSQCTVNGVASSVSASGTDLTLNLRLGLIGAYTTTPEKVYFLAVDSENRNTGWIQTAIWGPTATLQPLSFIAGNITNSSAPVQTFSATVHDPAGLPDIQLVYFLVNPAPSVPDNTCHGVYVRYSNALYLYNNTLTAVTGPLTPGTTSTIQNSQCSVDGITSSVTTSETDLTLTIGLGLLGSYTVSAEKVYFLAVDNENRNTGWYQTATWDLGASMQPLSLVDGPMTISTAATQTFPATVRDPTGFADIQLIYFLVNPNSSIPQNSCHGVYIRASNSLYLYNDTLTSVSGPLTPGTPGMMQNSQCTLDGMTSSVSASSTDISLTLALGRRGSYLTTAENVYFLAVDNQDRNTGWIQTGTWAH